MNKLFTLVLLVLLTGKAWAQEPCLSEILFQQEAKIRPELLVSRAQLEAFTQSWIEQNQGQRAAGVPYVIPVVFHIIHYGGSENITRAQCVNQLDSLNKDFSYQNADKINTPPAFQPIAADCNIEFRMAQKDTNGNCTDGVTRTYSPLTTNARNNVKGLIHWPSNKYLNIYVVSFISTSNGVVVPGSYVAGFAQFPGIAENPLTDGIVIRSDALGSIGTSSIGRTATHEIGHWLNLRHIWGDATCGNDLVGDTPPQQQPNLGLCPTFPYLSNCTGNAPNGDNFSNYMDYSDNDCQNMFTIGQSTRMAAALSSATSGRSNLHSAFNLLATGTDGTPPVTCGPRADFIPRPLYVCAGGTVTFKDLSWNGVVTSRNWTFAGGTPLNDTSANPTITYTTPGIYDVTLSATNAGGTDTKTVTGMVVVSDVAATATLPFTEGFEGGTGFPYTDWYLYNSNGGNQWEETTTAVYSGARSLRLVNFSNNDKGYDEFITPDFDFSNVATASMNFKMAFAFINTTTGNDDKLTVSYSTDCGKTWNVRLTKQGSTFPTVSNVFVNSFVPTSTTQWRNETVAVNTAAILGKPNVRFRFEFTHSYGNNIYIDDININCTFTNIDELNAQNANVSIYPNPASDHTFINFSTFNTTLVKLEMLDVSGRVINIMQKKLNEGNHHFELKNKPEPGVYFVRLWFGESAVTKKLVVR